MVNAIFFSTNTTLQAINTRCMKKALQMVDLSHLQGVIFCKPITICTIDFEKQHKGKAYIAAEKLELLKKGKEQPLLFQNRDSLRLCDKKALLLQISDDIL